ncbi:hypothetical protein [Candidatus Albibeggiatoa sp. nov. NOAA]|uniref:DUF6980 family protein n=1 Tax=Candidatus Albibeggiatoa sp. nov. NOAA TaxID=3162724 RepID=UPI0032FFD15E|nr:hypothetical protein [Thiotrichaceae bacterium]
MFCCQQMKQFIELDDLPIIFTPKFREFGILYLDGGSAHQCINYCPWCGTKLPTSLRDQWCDIILDVLKLEPDDPNIPKKYLTDEWYKQK